MINWKAILTDKTTIYKDFSKHKDKVETIIIMVKRYIYQDPTDSDKELNFPTIMRRYKTVPITLLKTDYQEYKYDVKYIPNKVIQEAYMKNLLTGKEQKVGIRLTIGEAVIYFDDISNTVMKRNNEN